jgi:hypothetical protein
LDAGTWIEVEIGRLVVDDKHERYQLELQERGGRRQLRLEIGVVDTALCERLRDDTPGGRARDPNRLTLDVAAALGARVVAGELRIGERGAPSGALVLEADAGRRERVGARAIDAVLVAARAGAPLRVTEVLLADPA